MARSLDLAEQQVLVNYPADADGFFWHHRVMLCRVRDALWLALTPDLEIVQVDLATIDHVPLPRAGPMPFWAAGQGYIFDPLDAVALREFRREARQRAVLLGYGQEEEQRASTWIVVGLNDRKFGETVDPDIVEDPNQAAVMEDKGTAMIEGEVRFIQRVEREKKEEFVKELRSSSGDIRFFGDYRDEAGKRAITLRDAKGLMTEDAIDDWVDEGPRVVGEYLDSVVDSSETINNYRADFVRLSGVAEGSAQCHEHKSDLETLRRAIQIDQLNVRNLTCFENLVRRLIQLEVAIERNPRHPDFTGLEEVTGGPTTSAGTARVPKFMEHVTARQRDKAQIWKQSRLFREEQEREYKRSQWLDGKGRGKGKEKDGKGDKTKKKKKKEGAGADAPGEDE